MANTTLLSVKLTDDADKSAAVNIFLPAAATIAQLQAFSDALLPYLDQVTGAKIAAVTVALNLTLPGGLKASPLADHLLQFGSNWAFDAANTPYRHTVHVPAVDTSKVVGGEINVSDSECVSWTNFIATGDGTLAPVDPYANDLSAFLGAVVSFRKR